MSTDRVIYNIRSAIGPLLEGQIVHVRDFGDSMQPLIMSGEVVAVLPYDGEDLQKGDVVLAKVEGKLYMHKVTALRGKQVQISNNRGKVNGWTTPDKIYGKVIM